MALLADASFSCFGRLQKNVRRYTVQVSSRRAYLIGGTNDLLSILPAIPTSPITIVLQRV